MANAVECLLLGYERGLDDLGYSFSEVFSNPKWFRKLEEKLAKEQRILSRRRQLAIKRKCQLSAAKNYQKPRCDWYRRFTSIKYAKKS